MTTHDQRHFPRLDIRLPVTLRYCGRLIPATTLNVSCGGMLLITEPGDITSNAPVEVIFDLPNNERDVTMRGEIVRIGGNVEPEVGIRFTNLYTLGYHALERFVKSRQHS